MIPLCVSNLVGECPLIYNEQPPTTLSCSPYNDLTFRLRLACRATKNGGSVFFDSFDLYWHRRRSSDGIVENLVQGEASQIANAERIVLSGIEGLSNAPFSEEIPGEYWCQAVITTSSEQYLVIESNILMVLRPEDYVGRSVCSTVQFVDSQKCAVNTSNGAVSQLEAASSSLTSVQVEESPSQYFTGSEVEATQIQMVSPINESG